MKDSSFSWQDNESHRIKRIRRSSLLNTNLDALDRPSIKLAETSEEYLQAFRLLHEAYVAARYLARGNPGGLYFNVHQLLPKTSIFLFKSLHTVISTMSYIPDTPQFGLPMDVLYKCEVDALRQRGRKIVEIGSLATASQQRGNNIVMLLARAAFQFAVASDVDDVCIMTNPKHFKFYNSIFLFEALAEKRHYNRLNAPAIALRADMRNIHRNLRERYDNCAFDVNICAFLTRKAPPHVSIATPRTGHRAQNLSRKREACNKLITQMPTVLDILSGDQYAALRQCYEKEEAEPGRPRIITPGRMR